MKPPDAALEALWKNVLDNWELDAAHLAFLEHCRSHDALDHAAARYSGMKGDRDRGAAAEKRLRAVLMLAMAKLEVSRAEPKAASGTAGKLALIAFFLLGSLVLLTILMRS